MDRKAETVLSLYVLIIAIRMVHSGRIPKAIAALNNGAAPATPAQPATPITSSGPVVGNPGNPDNPGAH